MHERKLDEMLYLQAILKILHENNSVRASMEYLRPVLQPSSGELDCLFPGQRINGDVINAYMRLLERRSIFYATVPVTYSVDTYFFETWERGGYDRVKSAFKGINLFSRDLILFPLHLRDYEGGHWALIAVKPKLNLIRSLDSLGHPRTKEMRVILEFMENNAAERKVLFDRDVWIICNTPDECPKQQNATDCGAFVCAYAELLSAGDTPSGKTINPLETRKDVARALRRGKISQEDFRVYGEAGDRMSNERVVAVAEEDFVLIRELSEAIGDLVPASPELPLSRGEEDDPGRGIVLPDLTMEEPVVMTPRTNTPTDERTSSWLSITASETWEMVEDENCSAPEIRVSAPAAKPRTPTSPAVATMTCEDARHRLHDHSSVLRNGRGSNPRVWKTKRPRHPVRVRLQNPDGTWYRTNAKNVTKKPN
ncbi:Sentrin-specific protease 2 [Homalodisca vitripennis]|nr:Sentrin-specific protease 2 [Homalodisca vitripennis]